MKKCVTLAALLSTSFSNLSAAASDHKVRVLHLRKDDIALVKTALGVATLIQVPDRPTSVVLGDSNAFKVEYLENAITIKPLGHGAKSNLYIYTEGRRFNVSLVTAPQAQADFIVYLEPEAPKPDSTREYWRLLRREGTGGDIHLRINRIGFSGDVFLIDFDLTSDRDLPISPEWFWLKQNGKTIPIQTLNLSELKISKNRAVRGRISFQRADIKSNGPIFIELRSASPVSIQLPEVRAWKR